MARPERFELPTLWFEVRRFLSYLVLTFCGRQLAKLEDLTTYNFIYSAVDEKPEDSFKSLKKWSGRADLNHRPPGPEPGALARLRYAPTVSLHRTTVCAGSLGGYASRPIFPLVLMCPFRHLGAGGLAARHRKRDVR